MSQHRTAALPGVASDFPVLHGGGYRPRLGRGSSGRAPLALTFWETGLVPRLPTAVLCAALGLASGGSFLSGVVLDSVSRGRQEQKRMAYLRYPSVQEAARTMSPSSAGA